MSKKRIPQVRNEKGQVRQGIFTFADRAGPCDLKIEPSSNAMLGSSRNRSRSSRGNSSAGGSRSDPTEAFPLRTNAAAEIPVNSQSSNPPLSGIIGSPERQRQLRQRFNRMVRGEEGPRASSDGGPPRTAPERLRGPLGGGVPVVRRGGGGGGGDDVGAPRLQQRARKEKRHNIDITGTSAVYGRSTVVLGDQHSEDQQKSLLEEVLSILNDIAAIHFSPKWLESASRHLWYFECVAFSFITVESVSATFSFNFAIRKAMFLVMFFSAVHLVRQKNKGLYHMVVLALSTLLLLASMGQGVLIIRPALFSFLIRLFCYFFASQH